MPIGPRAEIAKVSRTDVRLAQFDFGYSDRAPSIILRDWFSGRIKDRREYPSIFRFHERAANDLNVTLKQSASRTRLLRVLDSAQ